MRGKGERAERVSDIRGPPVKGEIVGDGEAEGGLFVRPGHVYTCPGCLFHVDSPLFRINKNKRDNLSLNL